MCEVSAQQHLLPIVAFLAMLTIGLELSVRQFRELFRKPGAPVLGTLIHTFTFPVVALAVVLSIEVMELEATEAMLIDVLLIAACPSGGFSNVLTLIAQANLTLSIVLTAVSTIFSMVTVPLLL
jgi:bile acid:Na+ symporter, BASS family